MKKRNVIIAGVLIVLAAGILLPAISYVRTAAVVAKCRNNLKHIGMAISHYNDSFGCYPPAGIPNKDLPEERRLSWLLMIVPFIEAGNLYQKVDKEKGWDAEENRLYAISPYGNLFHCPAFPDREPLTTLAPTHYLGIAGIGKDSAMLPADDPKAGFFGFERIIKVADIKDGTDKTIMVMETIAAEGSWLAAGPPTVRGLIPNSMSYFSRDGPFGGTHRGIANLLLVDGSVRYVSESINSSTLQALATIAGGEKVGDDF